MPEARIGCLAERPGPRSRIFNARTGLPACLIRGVCSELEAPQMNAVIGVPGFSGELETERYRRIEPQQIPWRRERRKAMAAPAELTELKSE